MTTSARLAQTLLLAGVESLGDCSAKSMQAAIEAFRQAISYGSDEAMAWLGAALIDQAKLRESDAALADATNGLGWLATAQLAGVGLAEVFMSGAIGAVPPAAMAEWRLLPPHAQITVH